MNYDQRDFLADSYIPLLILLSIACLIRIKQQGRKKDIRNALIILLGGSAQTYLIMAFDKALGLWPAFHLDYSTHTSLALVFVVFLAFLNRKFLLFSTVSMVVYVALMLYQEYHTIEDVLMTAAVVLPGLLWLNFTFSVAQNNFAFRAHKQLANH